MCTREREESKISKNGLRHLWKFRFWVPRDFPLFLLPKVYFMYLQTPSRVEPVLADKEVLLTALNIKAMAFSGSGEYLFVY